MCILRASYFSGPWRPLLGSFWVLLYLESYASSVCTYCSLFPGISSALTLPLCLPGSLHLFLMMICWRAILTILAIITITTITAFINIITTWSKPARLWPARPGRRDYSIYLSKSFLKHLETNQEPCLDAIQESDDFSDRQIHSSS